MRCATESAYAGSRRSTSSKSQSDDPSIGELGWKPPTWKEPVGSEAEPSHPDVPDSSSNIIGTAASIFSGGQRPWACRSCHLRGRGVCLVLSAQVRPVPFLRLVALRTTATTSSYYRLGVYGLPSVLRGRPIKGARAAGRHVPPFSSQCRSSATTRRRVTAEPRALRSTPPVAISRPDPTEGAGFLRPHHRHGNRPLALRRADTIAERFGELSPPQQRSHARSLYRGDE